MHDVIMSDTQLRERYSLLCRASQRVTVDDHEVEQALHSLTAMVEQEFASLVQRGCPNTVQQALGLELVRFRAFCQYPALSTKVIVALGGSFSAGKSTLINALLGERCLVTEVDPTTSLPTYVIQEQEAASHVEAITLFNQVISLSHDEFRTLTHDERRLYGSQISGLLRSVIVSHPGFIWEHLALLDTPGYSKAEDTRSTRTDAHVARAQLNSAQFIVWLVPADKGTISEEDLVFLSTLERTIPKLVVVSRADKHTDADVVTIVDGVRTTLGKRGIAVVDVLPFSSRQPERYPVTPLLAYFSEWNHTPAEPNFAEHFKRQFMACQRVLDEQRHVTQRQLSKFNRIQALSDDPEILTEITHLKQDAQFLLAQTKNVKNALGALQTRFFETLKSIGNRVGVALPEPDAMTLLSMGTVDLLGLLHSVDSLSDRGSGNIDPGVWLPLMRDVPLRNLPKLLRREVVSYPALRTLSAATKKSDKQGPA